MIAEANYAVPLNAKKAFFLECRKVDDMVWGRSMKLKMKPILIVSISVLCTLITSIECVPQLRLLHVVFAHKTYAPIFDVINNNNSSLPTKLTYEHFNSASFNMPNTGKLNMYSLGVHLRNEYDQFLGNVYKRETMKMQTAEYPLSMVSGQLVNAGLWPPSEIQRWYSDLDWQPIPTDYVVKERDTLLLGMHCPSFVSEMRKVINTDRVQKTLLQYSPLFEHVSESTGMKIHQPSEIALLYSVLETKADLNQSLPPWSEDIFPDGGMYNLTLLEYELLSQTPLQKQLHGGAVIKEVLANSLGYIRGSIPEERKLMIYSGNDRNIVGILKSLDLWSPHIPKEAASMIFEMYFDNETESYGMKINYYMGIEGDTISLKIQNCTDICPLETFLNSFFDVLPQNEHLLCNKLNTDLPAKDTILESTDYSRSESHEQKIIIVALLFIVTLCVF